jgi:uncharacterized protein (TIGR02569 family)
MTLPPSPAVLAAFGTDGDPIAMGGGEGMSFRAGDLVLKRVHDADEAEWTQALLSRTEQDGFCIPEPVHTNEGRWVHHQWSASRFVDHLRPAAPLWRDIADAGLRFADAAEGVRDRGDESLAGRTHRWAVADRVAWGEARIALDAEAADVHQRIWDLVSDAPTERHLVHGDLSGNVYFGPDGVPVILDVSPYLRPRRWAVAIVVADAVLWNGAELSLAKSFGANPADLDLLGRALIFRMVAEQLADDPRHRALLQPYRAVLTALT